MNTMNNYSGTKCPKCESISFELVEDTPTKSNYKYYYLRCSSCRTFLTTEQYLNTNAMLQDIEKDLDKIKKKLLIS